jgi:hypothetical protein
MGKATISASDREMAKQTLLLLRKPKVEPKKGRKTNFFSLPQIIRQKVIDTRSFDLIVLG